jgi:phosphatidylglycerophosphate synthase
LARIQENLLAKPERRLLNWLCVKLGDHVTSDQMTLVGVAGAVLVLAGDLAGRANLAWLWVAVLGYFLHWFGDSLDGSIARYQGKERPKYGYFLDHSVDALTNFMIMLGLGLSGHVRMDIALAALVGYFMLSIYVFLRQHVLNEFQLSFLVMGPTELRVCLTAITLGVMYLGDFPFRVGDLTLTVYDGLVAFAAVVFYALFLVSFAQTATMLRKAGG